MRAILRYLEENTSAKDTLEGIAQWWLLREWSKRKVVEVEGAVSLLLSKDLIVETGGTVCRLITGSITRSGKRFLGF